MINLCNVNELKKFSMYPPIHSKWDLVGYIGSSLVLENAVQRWGRPIGPKCTGEPVKSPYGAGRYCDMAVSSTRSHLLCLNYNNLDFH